MNPQLTCSNVGHRRFRSLSVLVLLLPIVGFALAGCGGGGGSNSANGSTGTSATPIPAATATPTGAATPSTSPTPTTETPAAVVLFVAPASVTMNVNASTAFTASITGINASQAFLVWSVQESNGGSISADGIYSAPPVPGTYHVVASIQAASVSPAVATVVVQAGDASGTIQ